MSEIFIIKDTGKGVITGLPPEKVVPVNSVGSTFELTEENVGTFMDEVLPTKLTPFPEDTLLARDSATNLAVEIPLSEIGKGQYIPLNGTEEGKNITGSIKNDYLGDLITNEDSNFKTSLTTDINSGFFGIKCLNKTNSGESYVSATNVCATLYVKKNNIIKYFQLTPQTNIGALYTDFNPNSCGISGNRYFGEYYNDLTYVQKKYVDKTNSYSTNEIKTGGKWIDDKDIYTITQLTADTPPTMETVFPTEVIGTYTVYKYTKP